MPIDPYAAGRDALMPFCILTDTRYAPNWHHRLIAKELELLEGDVIRGHDKQIFLIIEMPPRHGKSELATIKFPAWFLGKNPEKEIITASYSGDLALDFGASTRTLVGGSEYQSIFSTKLKEDEKSKGRWKTSKGGSYTSVGVGGITTGRGSDIFLIDDPIKNREEAESLVYREKVWAWWKSTAYTRLEPNAAMIFIMTRWNSDDLVGRVLEMAKDREDIEIRRLNFPAIATKTEVRDNKKLRDKGEALWDERYSVKNLATIRSTLGELDWQALYQQDPIRASGALFKEIDFRYFALSDLNKDDFTLGIHIDPAFSTRETSDDTAITVTAQHKVTKEIYIFDIFGEPILPSDAWRYVISTAEKWKSGGWTLDFISVEDVDISKDQQSFVAGLENAIKQSGKFYTLLTMNPRSRGKKEDRIKYSLEPVVNRHALYFREDDSQNVNWRNLKDQFLRFPFCQNGKDDLIDSVSQGVIMWENRGTPDTSEQVERSMGLIPVI